MRHPLIDRLLDEYGYPEITLENHETFVGRPGVSVLFFAGDPRRYKETTDVAVILPELVAATGDGLRPGVVARSAEIELQKLYGFRAWPCLVLVREGGYLGAISRVRDWSEYLAEIGRLLVASPGPPPSFDYANVPQRGPASESRGA
jgi:hydrogenase-1 operon protein HyaE